MDLVTIVVICFSILASCAGPDPILGPNKRLLLYGREAAESEIEACREKTERAGLRHGTSRGGNAAAGGTLGVVAGAAVGASTGLVGGPSGVAIGAAAGAALGGILGVIAGAYKPLAPDPGFTASMEGCLKDKGYEVTGWE
jgi:hypothetical protein